MRSLIPLLFASLALAGCLGDDEPDIDTTYGELTEDGLVLPWGLSDCQAAIAILPATTGAVSPYLPPGFRSLSMEEVIETGTDLAGEANLGVELLVCDSGANLTGDEPDMAYASYFTAVEPPEDLRENVTLHFVKWDVMIPDDERRMHLQSLGIPAVPGDGSWNLHQGQATNWVFNGQLDLDGASFTFTGATLQPAPSDVTFVEFQETDRGLVRWHATVDTTRLGSGPATVTLPSSGMASDIVGLPVSPAAAFGGMVTFTESTITVPV